jgi:hypothetical protein
LRPDGIEMDVADQLEEVRLLLHYRGPVPILEQVPDTAVPAIESAGVTP